MAHSSMIALHLSAPISTLRGVASQEWGVVVFLRQKFMKLIVLFGFVAMSHIFAAADHVLRVYDVPHTPWLEMLDQLSERVTPPDEKWPIKDPGTLIDLNAQDVFRTIFATPAEDVSYVYYSPRLSKIIGKVNPEYEPLLQYAIQDIGTSVCNTHTFRQWLAELKSKSEEERLRFSIGKIGIDPVVDYCAHELWLIRSTQGDPSKMTDRETKIFRDSKAPLEAALKRLLKEGEAYRAVQLEVLESIEKSYPKTRPSEQPLFLAPGVRR